MDEFDVEMEDLVEGAAEGEDEEDLTDEGAAAESLASAAEAAAKEAASSAAPQETAADRAASAVAGAAEALGAAADGKINKMPEKEVIKQLDKIINGDKLFRDPEAMLSRTERLLLNQLSGALKSGDLKSVQDGLATIAENPAAVKAVMTALKARLENSNPLNSVRWETGTDNRGNNFVRLHIDQRHDASKSSGSTSVMVGSDGTHSASRTKRWDSPSTPVAPGEALADVTQPAWRNLKPFKPGDFLPKPEDTTKPNGEQVKPNVLQGAFEGIVPKESKKK